MVGLPPDEFGWPYQVLTLLDPGGSGIGGLYEGKDGRLRAWRNTPEGRPAVPAMQPVPHEVEAAARRWWDEHRSAR
jgi:hypothetical protein